MMNKALLVGRLTKEPELKTTTNGTSVCSFTVAIPRRFSKSGTERQSDFINCVAWRQTAEFLTRYFNKGNLVSVEGEIQTRSYDDSDGKKRYVTEVVVDNVRFVEGRKDDNNSYGAPARDNLPELPPDISVDDIEVDLPFY